MVAAVPPTTRDSVGHREPGGIARATESDILLKAECSGGDLLTPGDAGTDQPGYPSAMRTQPRGGVEASVDRSPELADVAIAVGLAVLASLWLWVRWLTEREPSAPVIVGLGLVLGLPLAWRRRFPLAVLAVVTLTTILYGVARDADAPWAANIWLLAAYSAGAYGVGRRRDSLRAAAAAVFVGYLAYLIFVDSRADGPAGTGTGDRLSQIFQLAGNAAFVAWIWWFGDTARLRFRREAQLAERTRQLEQERETNARRAVLDERVRIARELHDVVAHHVSLMGVQAGAARRVLHRQPEEAERALSAIETSSREAVRELHRLLGFLRRDEESDGLAPQPSLRRLDDLLGQMRAAGLPITLQVDGEARPLPPAVDLSAYRILQEALTNALRHAGPATATVRLRYGARDLLVEVIDDGYGMGVAGRTPATTGGAGLVGMRERVGLLGGRLRIEQPPAGGYAVRAELPFDGGPA